MKGRLVVLREGADLDGFRRAVRGLVAGDVAPQQVSWTTGTAGDLFGTTESAEAPAVALPRALGEWIDMVVCHRDPERHALLYTLIWRVLHGERMLMDLPSDPLVHRLARMRKAVGRDVHKMHAFLRFRRIEEDGAGERFAAWFEPDHFILEAVAGFFVDRFRSLVWSILTPVGSLHWKPGDLDDRAAWQAGRRSCRRLLRNGLAELLQEHLQSGSGQSRPDALGDAEEILAQPAGDQRDPGIDPSGPHAR